MFCQDGLGQLSQLDNLMGFGTGVDVYSLWIPTVEIDPLAVLR